MADESATKPWWKRWWVIVLGVLVAMFVIGTVFGEEDEAEKSSPTTRQGSVTTVPVTAPPTTKAAPPTTDAELTDLTCIEAFRDYSADLYDDPTIDELPYQRRTLTDCAGKVTWLVQASKFQGNRPTDLFPPGGRDVTADFALRRAWAAFCDGNEQLPACVNEFR